MRRGLVFVAATCLLFIALLATALWMHVVVIVAAGVVILLADKVRG